MSGRNGVDVAQQLPFAGTTPFAVSFVPWLAPQGVTEGTVAASSASGAAVAEYTFALEGPASKQGWVTISAWDASKKWQAERRVRVVQRVFSYAWRLPAWQ